MFSDPKPPPATGAGVVGRLLHWLGEGTGTAKPAEEDFIKRVIALPGETVADPRGQGVRGRRIDEPYLGGPADHARLRSGDRPRRARLFVLGDNRLHSCDSRFTPDEAGICHGLGYVPEDDVIGQAFVIVWPPSDMGWLH